MSRILIAEDEQRIASFIRKGLEAHGFATATVTDGSTALELAQTGSFDLMVLDIGLPGMKGFAVLRELRASGSTMPVIVLTARTATEDTVKGLTSGADDYMHKPFAFEELLARVLLRIRGNQPSLSEVIEAGNVKLDLRTRRVTVGDRPEAELTAREFSLLEVFVRHPDAVLSRQQLLSSVWGLDFDPGSNVVDVYVRYLRGKLGEDAIETVRGAGYRLRLTNM